MGGHSDPFTIYAGAAILGRLGGEMIMTDRVVAGALHPSHAARYIVDAALLVAVLIVVGGGADRWPAGHCPSCADLRRCPCPMIDVC